MLDPAGQVHIESFEVPVPAADQVLVRVTCTQVSAGTEMNGVRQRRLATPEERSAFSPTGLGYTAVGYVEAVGKEITDFAPGDRVLCAGHHGTHWLVTPSRALDSASILQEHMIEKLPADISDTKATFSVLGDVALHGVRRAQLQIGESVAVHGLGVVGLLTLQVYPTMLRAAADRGRLIMVGAPPGRVEIEAHELLRRELTVRGSYQTGMLDSHPYWPWTRARNRDVILGLIARGQLAVQPLISHVVPYTQAPAMYDKMMAGGEGWMSILFTWT